MNSSRTTRLLAAALVLLLSLASLSRLFPRSSPLLGLRSPAPLFTQGFSLVGESSLPAKIAGLEVCREGLRRFPWYGPGWLCLGIATQSWLGDLAAMPLYELAARLDPQGMGVKQFALPVLLRFQMISVEKHIPGILFPQPPRSLVAALPEDPPPSWLSPPLPYSPAFLEPFYLEGRWQWLAQVEESELSRELSPPARGYTLYGFCILKDFKECRNRMMLCLKKAPSCSQGVTFPEGALLRLAERAMLARDFLLAEELLREEFASTGSERAHSLLIRVLEEEGKTREALRLKGIRTHRMPP